MEMLSFINLSGLLTLILCGYAILIIYLGDWLIKKYDLQNRHPIFTKILLLRWVISRFGLVY